MQRGDVTYVRITAGWKPNGLPRVIERRVPDGTDPEKVILALRMDAEIAKVSGTEIGSPRGRRPPAQAPVEAPSRTVADLIDAYLAWGQREWPSPKTYPTVKSLLNKHARAALGSIDVDALAVEDWTRLEKAATKISTRTANNVMRNFRMALNWAKGEGWDVPDFVFARALPRVKAARKKGEVDADTVRKLFDAADALGPQEGAIWRMRAFFGLRLSEPQGCGWTDLDLDSTDPTYRLEWQLQAVPYDGPRSRRRFLVPDGFDGVPLIDSLHLIRPKRDSLRVLPIPQPLLEALKTWREVAPDNRWGLVFTDDDGAYPRRDTTDRSQWELIQEMAGVGRPDGKPYTIHELRHGAATLLREGGTPETVIQAILGHTQPETTGLYGQQSRNQARAALERVADAIDETEPTSDPEETG